MKVKLISITEYCSTCNIDPEFILSLEDSGIITLTGQHIHPDQFTELERYIHLHYDLHINIEGIDAIRHLLGKVDRMQREIHELKTRLQLHQ